MDNGPFIVDLPIKMVIFYSYVNVYQRVLVGVMSPKWAVSRFFGSAGTSTDFI